MCRTLWIVLLAGCFTAQQYAVQRPELGCERANRVAYRTMVQLGYTVTAMVTAEPFRVGMIAGEKPGPDGQVLRGKVRITCDGQGTTLQPVEDSPVPNFEFSREFGYSFKSLVQMPDVEEPREKAGLQIQVRRLDRFQQQLDLGGIALGPGADLVRVTVRNDTDRAAAIEPSGVELASADGATALPLAGGALDAALAGGGAERVRAELLRKRLTVAPRTSVVRFLVYPAGQWREARVSVVDVETDETEGFVAGLE